VCTDESDIGKECPLDPKMSFTAVTKAMDHRYVSIPLCARFVIIYAVLLNFSLSKCSGAEHRSNFNVHLDLDSPILDFGMLSIWRKIMTPHSPISSVGRMSKVSD